MKYFYSYLVAFLWAGFLIYTINCIYDYYKNPPLQTQATIIGRKYIYHHKDVQLFVRYQTPEGASFIDTSLFLISKYREADYRMGDSLPIYYQPKAPQMVSRQLPLKIVLLLSLCGFLSVLGLHSMMHSMHHILWGIPKRVKVVIKALTP